MDTLPNEILAEICEFVAGYDIPSLFQLSRVDKRTRAIALHLIFHTITFSITSRVRLNSDVDGLLDILSRNAFDVGNGLEHAVRRIIVNGAMPTIDADTNRMTDIEWKLDNHNYLGEDEIFGTTYADWKQGVFTSDGPPIVEPDEDIAWHPLARFVGSISPGALTDLEWNEPSQFPPCMLDALASHSNLPCRLHIPAFRLRSLSSDILNPRISTYELALIRSPCLYSIAVCYVTWRDSAGKPDFNEEAVLEMVSGANGIAPNLKEVKMIHCRPASSAALMRARGLPKGQFRGLEEHDAIKDANTGQSSQPSKKSTLHSFSLTRCAEGPRSLDKWMTVADLSGLRRLSLGTLSYDDYTHIFGVLGPLRCLTQLEVSFSGRSTNQSVELFFDNAPNLFFSIVGLKSLSLSGHLRTSVVTAALKNNASTLQHLKIKSSATIDDVPWEDQPNHAPSNISRASKWSSNHNRLIVTHCHTALHTLILRLRRTHGDVTEVSGYRTLGALPHLRNLFLLLDCSNPRACEEARTFADPPSAQDMAAHPAWNAFDWGRFDSDQGFRNGHVKDALANCAVDAKLARGIFNAISPSAEAMSRFEQLKVHPEGGVDLGQGGIRHDHSLCTEHLQQSWLVKRRSSSSVEINHREDDGLIVTPLGKKSREAREGKYGCRIGSQMELVVRRLWDFPEGEDFREHWKSLPLQQV